MAKLPPPLAELLSKLDIRDRADLSEFAPKVISGLVSIDEFTASELSKEFLIAQIEYMLLTDLHEEEISQELTYAMELEGFMTLRRLEGLKTPAAWLYNELTPVFGEGGVTEFMDMTEYLLTLQFDPVRIDDWLVDNFMESHTRRTEWAPRIVHLSSPERAIELLIPLDGLTRERICEITERVVVQTVNENTRFRVAMEARFDFESAAEFEARIYDAQQFERRVIDLVDRRHAGSVDMEALNDAGLLGGMEEPANPRLRRRSLLPDDWRAR